MPDTTPQNIIVEILVHLEDGMISAHEAMRDLAETSAEDRAAFWSLCQDEVKRFAETGQPHPSEDWRDDEAPHDET